MIEIRDVTKQYGDKVVLDGFSLSLEDGECVLLMGPSGCGKTTLCRMLLGFEKPDGGTIEGVPARVAAAFQEDLLCPHLSAADNLRLTKPRMKADEARAALAEMGLEEAADTRAADLSGGMARRVSLLRALLSDAPLLILDEPFRALDEDSHRLAAEVAARMRRGRTLLCVSHDPDDAARIGADRVVTMGEAAAAGPAGRTEANE